MVGYLKIKTKVSESFNPEDSFLELDYLQFYTITGHRVVFDINGHQSTHITVVEEDGDLYAVTDVKVTGFGLCMHNIVVEDGEIVEDSLKEVFDFTNYMYDTLLAVANKEEPFEIGGSLENKFQFLNGTGCIEVLEHKYEFVF